jgi:flagellar biosynthesis chaperone FliJ
VATETKTAGQITHDLEGRLGEVALEIESASQQIAEIADRRDEAIAQIHSQAITDINAVQDRVSSAKEEGRRLEAAVKALKSL